MRYLLAGASEAVVPTGAAAFCVLGGIAANGRTPKAASDLPAGLSAGVCVVRVGTQALRLTVE